MIGKIPKNLKKKKKIKSSEQFSYARTSLIQAQKPGKVKGVLCHCLK